MNKQRLTQTWDNFRQMHGITLRLIDSIPADKFDARPIPNMRTPKELIVHVYGMVVKSIVTGIATGSIAEIDEKAITASLKTKDDVRKFVNDAYATCDATVKGIADDKLNSQVETPWGMSFKGSDCIHILRDEYLHHRGQLYTYLRALGQDVPMVSDFEHNAPEFQPTQQATT